MTVGFCATGVLKMTGPALELYLRIPGGKVLLKVLQIKFRVKVLFNICQESGTTFFVVSALFTLYPSDTRCIGSVPALTVIYSPVLSL